MRADRSVSISFHRALRVEFILGFALALLWAYVSPFNGADGDAKIYIGRALADLDPNGVGRDLMFAHDGQSSFSIYRIALAHLASHVGFGVAVPVLSLLAMAAWFGAAGALAASIAEGRAVALVLAALFVLPRSYAPWHILGAGEIIAVPRPLAEACVLFALAAVLHRRWSLAVASLVLGMLLHPIMTLPGIATLLLLAAARDWRWIAAGIAVAAVFLIAALAGVPVVSRVIVRIDPLWRGVLIERNTYLFPHLWPAQTFALQIVQGVTLVIGASFLDARARRLFTLALGVGVAGLLAALTVGDGLSSLLVVQAQLWRAMWLPAVLAPMAFGLCLWHLLSRGAAGRIALAALCVAWLAMLEPAIGVGAALLAIGAHLAPTFISRVSSRAIVVAVWGACIVLTALALVSALRTLAVVHAALPAHEVGPFWPLLLRMNLIAPPVLLAVFAACRWPSAPLAEGCLGLAVALGLGVLPLVWDIRTPAQRDRDGVTLHRDLAQRLASRPGLVLWIGSDGGWWWAHRGNWDGVTQGGSMVFSRDLAMLWRMRTQAMLEYGLARRDMLNPWINAAPLTPLELNATAVGDFCRRPDAPAWIVVPLATGTSEPAGLRAETWRGPPDLQLKVSGDAFRWAAEDRYMLVPCAS